MVAGFRSFLKGTSMSNHLPKLHNAMWPGLVGKGSPGAEPCIDLDTMLDLTAKAEVNGVRFDGVDLFLYNPTTGIWVEAFSDGAGDFTYALGTWDAGWSVAMTDFNADGRGDLILSRNDGMWVQATNIGIGTFAYTVGDWGADWTVYTQKSPNR